MRTDHGGWPGQDPIETPPAGPPARPAGVPDQLHGSATILEKQHADQFQFPLVWAWAGQHWQVAAIRARYRTDTGWWLYSDGINGWLHESRTRLWAPDAEHRDWSDRVMGRGKYAGDDESQP